MTERQNKSILSFDGSAEGGLESISEQLARIQQYQEEVLRQKDRELEQLKSQLEKQEREISLKEVEIRNLERDRYRQQEERALELGRLVRRGVHVNPYQGQAEDECLGQSWICTNPPVGPVSRSSRQSPRLLEWIQGAILFVLVLHFYNLSQMQPQFRQMDEFAYHQHADPFPAEPEREPLKPWESTPPKSIPFMSASEPFIRVRHTCIKAVRDRQNQIFQKVLGQEPVEILLVDPAYHSNVGDHMLTVGELEMIETSLKLPKPEQCYYIQAGGFYDVCTKVVRRSGPDATNKVAMWHAGGNWGDLWRDAQSLRIPSFKTILENGYKVIGLPQSLFYLDESLKNKDATSIKEKVALGLKLAKEEYYTGHRRLEELMWGETDRDGEYDRWENDMDDIVRETKPVNTSALDTPEGIELAKARTIFMWREKESFEEASRLYPFVTNMIVPDMAFQLGPYARIRNHPKKLVDIVIFLREDHESRVDSERNEYSIRRMLPKEDMTFKIVDWSDREKIFGSTDPFFTDTSIELLSLGKIVVCDRLHAAILAYLAGLPFVYIDQVSGKVTKTLTAAFEEVEGCMDGEKARWARAMSLKDALVKASSMIDEHRLSHEEPSFLRSFINF